MGAYNCQVECSKVIKLLNCTLEIQTQVSLTPTLVFFLLEARCDRKSMGLGSLRSIELMLKRFSYLPIVDPMPVT